MYVKYLKDSFQCIDKNGYNHNLFGGCVYVIGDIHDNLDLLNKQ
jgi:hypothetical protein